MNEPQFRKPIFSFINFPSQQSAGEEVAQIKFVRVNPRGIMRLGFLISVTLTVTAVLAITVVYAATQTRVTESVVYGAVMATVSVVVLRWWTLGTYINDSGIKVIRTLSTRTARWKDINSIETRRSRWSCVGVPIPIRSHTIVVTTDSVGKLETSLFVGSPDGILSVHSLEVYASLITRWWMAK